MTLFTGEINLQGSVLQAAVGGTTLKASLKVGHPTNVNQALLMTSFLCQLHLLDFWVSAVK